jgi:sugar phosphate isomerase/epimerase
MDAVVAGATDADRFDGARRAGFAGVEVVVHRAELRSGGRLGALRALSSELGLALPSLVLGEHNDGGIASPDPAVAEAAAADIAQALGWAAELGADVILVPFFLEADLQTQADLERAAAAFRLLCPLAEERGVALCYEGTLPAAEVHGLAERVASPAFGCYFDLANPVVGGRDPAAELRALAPLVRRVHFKDAAVRRGDRRPGEGGVDFAACARALAEIAYDGWIVLETPAAPWEEVARDLAFARSVLPGLR